MARVTAPLADLGLARAYAAIVGLTLVALGVLGFFGNPIVGDPGTSPLLVTGTVHDMVHLTTGFLALYIAFATVGRVQANAVIAFGVAYLAIAAVLLLSPNLFGVLGPSPGYNAGLLDQLLHLAVGFVSVAIGIVARRQPGIA